MQQKPYWVQYLNISSLVGKTTHFKIKTWWEYIKKNLTDWEENSDHLQCSILSLSPHLNFLLKTSVSFSITFIGVIVSAGMKLFSSVSDMMLFWL